MAQSRKSFAVIFALACWFQTAFAQTPAPAQQEKPAEAVPTTAQVIPLKPGDKPIERDLKGGETHAYRLHVDSGFFLHFVADQLGIDVALTLYAPDGRKIASMDSPNGTFGLEQISTIAEVSGDYRLEVSSGDKTAAPGRYTMKVAPLRRPVEKDAKRIMAERESAEAMSLSGHSEKDSMQKAIAMSLEVLPLWHEAEEPYEEEVTLNFLATSYLSLGERQKALQYLYDALPMEQALGDQAGEAATLDTIGYTYSEEGQKQKALDFDNKALLLRRAVGDRAGEANTLNNLATVYADRGEANKALDSFKKALLLVQELGDRSSEAVLLDNIGSIYSDLGEKEKSLDYREKSLTLRRLVGDRRGEAGTLSNIAVVYSSLGEEQKALEYLEKALPLRQATGDRSGEATTLDNIGVVYFALGEKQTALEYFNKALPLRQSVEDRAGEAVSLNNIGSVYHDLGEKQKALQYYEKSLVLRQATGDRFGEADEIHNVGSLYADLGDDPKALEYYDRALELRRAIGDRSGQAATLHNIGVSYRALGQEKKALAYFDQSLPLSRATGNRFLEARTLVNIRQTLASSRPDTAILFGKQAVNVLQSIRRDNVGLEVSLRGSYEKSIEGYYRGLADLLVHRERFGEAEEVLDLLKDKEASDFIRRDSVSNQLHSATLLDSEKKALTRYDQIVDQVGDLGQKKAALLAKADKGQLTAAELAEEARLDQDLNAANTVLEKFLNEEEKALAPASAEARRVGELKEAEGLQDALAKLGPDVVAIYTLVTPDKYVALLVTPGARKAFTASIKEADLNAKIFEFRHQLQDRTSDPRPLAQQLYGIVFPEGLRHDLDAMHAKTIMWSIDSTLRYIPFAALYDGHEYLVQNFRQSLITPASIPYLTEEPLRQWTGIGFGVSESARPLPSVPGELHGIFRDTPESKSPIPGVVLLNAAFTHQSFADDLRQKRNPVVHIATHFTSRPGVAANSQLLLGDGELSLAEIESQTRLFNGVDLLTLSACNTAFTNKSEDGREIDSFGTIAQRLGAKSVIASLWSVDDSSTATLMQTMYRLRQQTSGMSKDEALRQAQITLLQTASQPAPSSKAPAQPSDSAQGLAPLADWSHPFYWAPFILLGNWK